MRAATLVVCLLVVALVAGGFLLSRGDQEVREAVRKMAPPQIFDLRPQTGGPCDPTPGTLPTSRQPVPNVVGLDPCDAKLALQRAGWAVVFTQQPAHEPATVPADGVITRQYTQPGTREDSRATVTIEVTFPAIEPFAPLGRSCTRENALLYERSVVPVGLQDSNRVPRWVAVADAHGTHDFVGCMPREFVNPEIDRGAAIEELWGKNALPGKAMPVFAPDGSLIGYAVNAAGFVPMNVITTAKIVPADVIARTPSYEEYNARG